MQILCPSCSAENNINMGREIVCGKCKASLSGFVYRKYKEPMLAAISALVIGAYGSYKIEHAYFDDARYPIRIEYAIIDSCATADRTNILANQFKSKKQICLCALEKTEKEITYAELANNTNAFRDTFNKNANSCK